MTLVNNNSYKFTAPMGFGGSGGAVSAGINDFLGGLGGGVRSIIKIYVFFGMGHI